MDPEQGLGLFKFELSRYESRIMIFVQIQQCQNVRIHFRIQIQIDLLTLMVLIYKGENLLFFQGRVEF